ncbi:DNA/RNA non-specific endonuclease [Maribellus luteus]|uniref:Endonuclease n=1 Tax=Maribellus luteus TaxID=2305463 RepID=A0A399SYX4_9BACT|nr:DNA/RNA non-specific endonuclease [Maribellus luteus]RIJ48014.1 DNA/RNA non-specific endonuclease [Maribellus luteus]
MRIKLTLAMLLSFMTGFAQNYTPKSPGKIVNHSSYSLAYSEQHEQAIWVLYHLTPEMVTGATGRSDDFRPDPKVSTQSASLEDYKGSGYDRGHLCPAADMKQSSTAMSETFYLSNMSPQVPGFNRGIWKNLEETVRKWSLEEDGIWVVTGAIFRDNKGTIGKNKVTVPGYYYKIIYDYSGEEKMIALILPNSEGKKQLSDYVVSVDRVEELTEVDFFPQLDDAIEKKLESQSDPGKWSFDRMVVQVKVQQKLSTSVQCTGTTKSGNRCKNKTNNTNGCCHLHQSQARQSSL